MKLIFTLLSFTLLFSFAFGQKEKKSDYEKGLAGINKENYEAAIGFFDKEIEVHPDNAQAYHKRGDAKAFLQDHQGALDDYNKAIELSPADAQAYSNRGIAKYNLKDKEGACADWNKAIELGFKEAHEMLDEYCE